MTSGYLDSAPLDRRHKLGDFRCTSVLQTDWLVNHGFANRKAGTSVKVQVMAEAANPLDVVAYFAWCMTAVDSEALPARFTEGAGGYPVQPFVLLARLGVHVDHEGQGLGSRMLAHVMEGTAEFSKIIGCRGLLIHAENDGAVRYYRSRTSAFMNVRGNQHHLLLLAKDINANLAD